MRTSRPRAWFLGAFSLSLLTAVRVESCRLSTGRLTLGGTGDIEVITSTVGEDIDPDGYTAAVTDELGRTRTRSIGTDDAVRFSALEARLDYTVELLGAEPNCEVVGADAVELFLEESETAVVAFEVLCARVRA